MVLYICNVVTFSVSAEKLVTCRDMATVRRHFQPRHTNIKETTVSKTGEAQAKPAICAAPSRPCPPSRRSPRLRPRPAVVLRLARSGRRADGATFVGSFAPLFILVATDRPASRLPSRSSLGPAAGGRRSGSQVTRVPFHVESRSHLCHVTIVRYLFGSSVGRAISFVSRVTSGPWPAGAAPCDWRIAVIDIDSYVRHRRPQPSVRPSAGR